MTLNSLSSIPIPVNRVDIKWTCEFEFRTTWKLLKYVRKGWDKDNNLLQINGKPFLHKLRWNWEKGHVLLLTLVWETLCPKARTSVSDVGPIQAWNSLIGIKYLLVLYHNSSLMKKTLPLAWMEDGAKSSGRPVSIFLPCWTWNICSCSFLGLSCMVNKVGELVKPCENVS